VIKMIIDLDSILTEREIEAMIWRLEDEGYLVLDLTENTLREAIELYLSDLSDTDLLKLINSVIDELLDNCDDPELYGLYENLREALKKIDEFLMRRP